MGTSERVTRPQTVHEKTEAGDSYAAPRKESLEIPFVGHLPFPLRD